MDPPHDHVILPTNATSAANPLSNTTPTASARDTVVETKRDDGIAEYVEIKTTGTDSKSNSSPTDTKTVEKVSTSSDYVLKPADVYKPLAVVSDTTSVNNPNNQIVGTTASGSLTTPGKIVGDMEPIVAEHFNATVAEPVTKKVVTTETTTTKK